MNRLKGEEYEVIQIYYPSDYEKSEDDSLDFAILEIEK